MQFCFEASCRDSFIQLALLSLVRRSLDLVAAFQAISTIIADLISYLSILKL
jgi:hypothetical protein